MLAPSSRHLAGSRLIWLEQSAHVSWMHCHQLVQSRQEYPKDLFWDLYFFSSISKTFLPQLMLSQPSLPTTQCCTGRICSGRQRHSMLFSTVWSDRPFEVGRRPSRALQWQQVSRTAHWCKTYSGTLTSGTGIPLAKPELSLDFAWSCLISFDRVQAARGRPRRSWTQLDQRDRRTGPSAVSSLLRRCNFWWRPVFVPLGTCILVCFCRLYSCLRWCSNILCSFGVAVPRSLFLQWHRMLHCTVCTPLWERWRALRRKLSQRSSWTKSG